MSRATPRVLLGLASVAIAFAAADTYVVVLALPDMMSASGLGVDELQRAAPIVSGFLLGYVGVLEASRCYRSLATSASWRLR